MACVCGSASSLFGSLEPLTHTETELSVWGGVGNAARCAARSLNAATRCTPPASAIADAGPVTP